MTKKIDPKLEARLSEEILSLISLARAIAEYPIEIYVASLEQAEAVVKNSDPNDYDKYYDSERARAVRSVIEKAGELKAAFFAAKEVIVRDAGRQAPAEQGTQQEQVN